MDLEESFRTAFATIADADSAIQAVTGRSTLNLVEAQNLGQVDKPVITMLLITMQQVGGVRDTREASWQFDAFADETTAGDQDAGLACSDLLNALEAALSFTNLDAQGLDATPTRPRPRRREVGTGEGKLRRKMLEMTFRITAP